MAESKQVHDSDDEDEDEEKYINDPEPPRLQLYAVSSNFPEPESLSKRRSNSRHYTMHSIQRSNRFSRRDLDFDNINTGGITGISNTNLFANRQQSNYGGRFGRVEWQQEQKQQQYQMPLLLTKGTERNLTLRLAGIEYDSQFDFDAEVDEIAKLRFESQRTV